jgi:hypothetical protein
MKKIFLFTTLFIGFFLSSNAQIKKTPIKKSDAKTQSQTLVVEKLSNETKVEKNMAELRSLVTLTPEMSNMMKELFTTKFRMLDEVEGLSIERRQTINKIIELKLESSIDRNMFEKIKSNIEIYKNLLN